MKFGLIHSKMYLIANENNLLGLVRDLNPGPLAP